MQRKQNDIVENGIYYTPEAVARELAFGVKTCMGDRSNLRILDPSCGVGALLQAAQEEMGACHTFHGCDLFPSSQFPSDKNWNFIESDFFDFSETGNYDIILTNPPYIQFGRIPEKKRKTLHEKYSKQVPIYKNCDIWVYFLLKALEHLRHGGTLAAVVPWSFLEAIFANSLRKWLAACFQHIQVLVLRDRHFDSTEKRVLLVWLSGYGKETESIQIGFSDHVETEHVYRDIGLQAWSSPGLITEVGFQTENLLAKAMAGGFSKLSDYASVLIGVVTGANDYFILPEHEAREKGFGENATIPILTTVEDIHGLDTTVRPAKVLLQFLRNTRKRSKYIKKGEKGEFHLRSHCKRRSTSSRQWYQVAPGNIPDAFFTYRVSTIPYMSLNSQQFRCTNSLHQVCFSPKVTEEQRKWIVVSILSSVSQLSLEHHGRHYGNGILKIEPSTLKNAMVYVPPRRKMPTQEYQKISELLKTGQKKEASKIANSLVGKCLNLPAKYWQQVEATLKAVRQRRM